MSTQEPGQVIPSELLVRAREELGIKAEADLDIEDSPISMEEII